MKKKKTRLFTVALLVLLLILSTVLTACLDDKGLPKKPELDDSIPLMSGTQITSALATNPDRGFRYELNLTLNDGKKNDYWAHPTAFNSDGTHTNARIAATETINYFKNAFQNQPIAYSTATLYVYLTEFRDRELTQNALDQLDWFLQSVLTSRIRVALRFCYQYRTANIREPSDATVIKHIDQLSDYFNSSTSTKNLIKDTVFVLQAGFLGVDGEWTGEILGHDGKAIFSHFYNMVPAGFYIQVHDAEVRSLAPVKALTQIGYVGDYTPNQTSSAHPSAMMHDGALPRSSGESLADGLRFIESMLNYRYTTFSAMHGFIEKTEDGSYGDYSINRWRSAYITETDIKEIDAPYHPNYFKDKNGADISRTVYDYVSDHLGYQLTASDLTVLDRDDPEKNPRVSYSTIQFTISNFGISAPLTLDNFEVVFAHRPSGGDVEISPIEILDKNTNSGLKAFYNDVVRPQWNPIKLTAYGQIKVILQDFRRNKGYAVGIRISVGGNKDKKPYYVRLANDVPYHNGVNFIYDYEQLGL